MAINITAVRISAELNNKIHNIQAKLVMRGIIPPPTKKFITQKIAEKIDEEDIVNEIIY